MDPARLAALLDRHAAGDDAAAGELFATPSVAEVADAIGGELGFRFACAELGHLLARPEELTDDRARERYSALVEQHGGDPARLAALRPLGDRIHQLEREGILPRSMVVRSRRRRD